MRDIATRLLLASALLVLLLLPGARLSAQEKLLITFPDVPCDSIYCDSLTVTNSDTVVKWISLLQFRDGLSYLVEPSPTIPDTIRPGTVRTLPVCFRPQRRGTISDSLYVVIESDSGDIDTLRVRLTGRGIGPDISLEPSVLNFPRTNPANVAALSMQVKNNGERGLTLSPGAIAVPPPFRLLTILPVVIPPGDSLRLDFSYEPTENGVFSVAVPVKSGCAAEVQIGLNGSTDLIGTGAVLRSSKQGFNPVNVEQIPCDVSRCTEVTLSNVGNATLNIESVRWAQGTYGYTLTPPPPTPFLVEQNGERRLRVCLNSTQRGMLRDTLIIESNTRTSIAFGLVIDVSNSMKVTMDCDTSKPMRLDQARIQAENFLEKTLLYLPSVGIQDQIAISRYSGTPASPFVDHFFHLVNVTDATRAQAQSAVNTTITTTVSGTETGIAISNMIDTLAKSPVANRVLVLLTDGLANDTVRFPVGRLADLARAANVRIFSIGLGLSAFTNPTQKEAAERYLQKLEESTQGATFIVEDCNALQGAFESITDIVSRGNIIREPFAMKITAPALVADRPLVFDSTYWYRTGAKDTLCSMITVTNVGEGDAILNSIAFADLMGGSTEEFFAGEGVMLPILIPESAQIDIPVCFSPNGLRRRYGKVSFGYNGCGSLPAVRDLSGTAYAKANLRITDERLGLPGTLATMPIHGDTSLAGFEVKTITYTVRWNKTMLDLKQLIKGPAAGAASVDITTPVTYDDNYCTVGITVSGADALLNPGEIAQLEFQVLRGNALSSDVELTAGNFEDGNPQTLLANAGMIAFDSTCFRSFKPLQARAPAAKIRVGEFSPNPSTGNLLRLPVDASDMTGVVAVLYAVDGTPVTIAQERPLEKGMNDLTFDVSGLQAGGYFLLLHGPSGETHFRKIIVER